MMLEIQERCYLWGIWRDKYAVVKEYTRSNHSNMTWNGKCQ